MNIGNVYKHVLYVGPNYKKPKGGIAAVLHAYSTGISPFYCVISTKGGKKIKLFTCYITAIFKYLYYLLKPSIKIVHIHGSSNGSFWRKAFLILIAKSFKKKIIYHIHGGGFKIFAKRHPKAVPFILGKCDIIIALSDFWKKYFEDELHCRSVYIIPNVIEEPHEDHGKRTNDICNFLFLGKVCHYKGIFDLLDTIGDKKEKYINKIKIYIGGGGEIERLNNTIEQYDLKEIVEYIGFVTGKKKENYLNDAHVFILPSYIEGVPISILEAMSYHLPVISTNVGGIPEILHDGEEGYIFEPGNKEQLAEKIDKILASNDERIKMGIRAFQISQPYIISNVLNELNSLYSKLLIKNDK